MHRNHSFTPEQIREAVLSPVVLLDLTIVRAITEQPEDSPGRMHRLRERRAKVAANIARRLTGADAATEGYAHAIYELIHDDAELWLDGDAIAGVSRTEADMEHVIALITQTDMPAEGEA